MNQEDIQQLVLDVSTDLIYLADIDTYELYYINSALLELLDNPAEEEWKKTPCYKLLQGRETPCDFCTNSILKTDTSSFWTQYNPVFQSWITYKDKRINYKGKNLRLEVARDITENVEISEILHDLIEEKRILIDCVALLESQSPPHISLQRLLKLVANFHDADRAHLLEFDEENLIASHAFEYCKEGVESQAAIMQSMDFKNYQPFLNAFNKGQPFRIKDRDTDPEMLNNPACYEEMKNLGITSLLVAPIRSHCGKLVGLFGVDNPKERLYAHSIIAPISTFISDCLERKKHTEKLTILSYTDSMTQLKNSHAFFEAHKELEENPPQTLGIAYIDINGLKQINDSLGHEAGNGLIVRLGEILQHNFKDKAFRIGGDEFIILMPNCEEDDFTTPLQALKDDIAKEEKLHIALGSNWADKFEHGIKSFIEEADKKMYQDKRNFYSSTHFDRRRPR